MNELDLKTLSPDQQKAVFAALTAAMQPEPVTVPEAETRGHIFGIRPTPRAVAAVAKGFNVLQSWPLIIVGIVLMVLVWHVAPAKMLLIAYGLAKGIVFALSGALTDYLLFPDDAPEALEGVAQGTSWKRRGLIVLGFLIVAAQLP